MRYLEFADTVAHFLHCPTMAGKRAAAARWHHHIHLIPGWLLKPICDRYDRSLWAEFDTPEDEINTMMAVAEPVQLTAAAIYGWTCPHLTITAGLPNILSSPTTSWCGCELRPIYGPLPLGETA